MAFNRYYNWEKEQKRVRSGEKRRFKNERGLKQSRTYDLNHTGKRVVDDVRYRRNPRGFDYEGVDTGDKVRAPRSPKQKARDAALKEKLSGSKGRISKAKLQGGAEKKYPDAKPGDVITLSNGAQAEVQANGRFKIVKGANAEHMTAMRKKQWTH